MGLRLGPPSLCLYRGTGGGDRGQGKRSTGCGMGGIGEQGQG